MIIHISYYEFVIVQQPSFINTDKLSLWLYNRKSLSTLANWVCDCTTAKVYEHREIKFVIIYLIIQRQKLINTGKLSLWLYNGKSIRTQRNQVCDYILDYTTAKAYQHWQTEFVIIQPQKSTNTENCDYSLDYTTAKAYQHWQTEFVIIQRWLCNRLYNGKSLWTQRNQLSLWLYLTIILRDRGE